MRIRGVTLDEFKRITEQISDEEFDGNVIVERLARTISKDGLTISARLTVKDSSGNGARRSASGRRMRAACWHAYRDVLAALFNKHPDAIVTTSMARYDGRDGFEATYPATAYENIGSMMVPVTMPETCDHGYGF